MFVLITTAADNLIKHVGSLPLETIQVQDAGVSLK